MLHYAVGVQQQCLQERNSYSIAGCCMQSAGCCCRWDQTISKAQLECVTAALLPAKQWLLYAPAHHSQF